MTERVVPCDLDAEAALLGAMLLAPEARDVAFRMVGAGDFYKPMHAALFDALLCGRESNPKADWVLLVPEVASRGSWNHPQVSAAIVDLMGGTPSVSQARRYADRVAQCANSRKVIEVAGRVAECGWTNDDDALAQARRLVTDIEPSGLAVPPQLSTVEDFEGLPEDTWLIPDIIGRDDRMMVVAAEKAGKAVLLRQIMACASQGIGPFGGPRYAPVRGLYVDLENPAKVIGHQHSLIIPRVRTLGGWNGSRFRVWHQRAGIDIRARLDRVALEAAIINHRPELVVLGPVYKAFSKQRGESDGDAVKAALTILDDLRTRHGFALILEAHAPFGEKGGSREMRPSDSSLWMRWLEYGYGLSETPKTDGAARRFEATWHIERMPTKFPRHLVHGSHAAAELPWVAYRPEGHGRDQGETF